jgi:hypothetical protein
VDDHTLLCLPGGVTYVPIPPGQTKNIAALMTFELPENVTRRQAFQVVIHQISGFPRSILGAFQISIPVSDKTILLEPEKRYLSVLRSIARAIPPDDQWHPAATRMPSFPRRMAAGATWRRSDARDAAGSSRRCWRYWCSWPHGIRCRATSRK